MSSYILSFNNLFWRHDSDRSRLLRDGDITADNRLKLQVQVASGDYFITLATKLDELSKQLESADASIAAALEPIVTELLQLQAHYLVVQKNI